MCAERAGLLGSCVGMGEWKRRVRSCAATRGRLSGTDAPPRFPSRFGKRADCRLVTGRISASMLGCRSWRVLLCILGDLATWRLGSDPTRYMVFQTFAGPTRRAKNMYQACPRRLVLLNSIATFASCKHGQGERGQWGRRVGGRESDPETDSVGTGLVRKCIYLESGVTCSDVRPATTIEQGYMVRRSKVSLRVAKRH